MNPSQEQLDKLDSILAEYKNCSCGQPLQWGDISWNNGSTEAGTPYASLQIECPNCGMDILCKSEWTEIEDEEDILIIIESGIEDKRAQDKENTNGCS